MPEVIEWRSSNQRDTLVHLVQQVGSGKLVIFPTDTSYVAVASGLFPEAIQRLAMVSAGIGNSVSLQIAVSGIGQALDWVPRLSIIAQRFARRIWPGPLTLAFPWEDHSGLLRQLPEPVQGFMKAEPTFQLRELCHEAIFQVVQYLPSPLFFRPVQKRDGMEITSPEEFNPGELKGVDAVLVDGKTYFSQPATVVEMDGNKWKVLRSGVVTEEDLHRLSSCQIIFVCTGNTCRSPLAEALCKKLLAERLECPPEELPARGFVVQSAGLSALPGGEAAPEAVETAQELGADLSTHRSQPLTAELLAQADHVLAMTSSHLHVLTGHGMNMILPPRLLSTEGTDVADPIGGEKEVYRECAQQILIHLQRRLSEFHLS